MEITELIWFSFWNPGSGVIVENENTIFELHLYGITLKKGGLDKLSPVYD